MSCLVRNSSKKAESLLSMSSSNLRLSWAPREDLQPVRNGPGRFRTCDLEIKSAGQAVSVRFGVIEKLGRKSPLSGRHGRHRISSRFGGSCYHFVDTLARRRTRRRGAPNLGWTDVEATGPRQPSRQGKHQLDKLGSLVRAQYRPSQRTKPFARPTKRAPERALFWSSGQGMVKALHAISCLCRLLVR